jgi:hypothetical protein
MFGERMCSRNKRKLMKRRTALRRAIRHFERKVMIDSLELVRSYIWRLVLNTVTAAMTGL